MGIFPGFGSWISKNTQQLLKTESKRSENDESKSASEKDTDNNAPANKKREYGYDEKEEMRQHILWHEEEKKHPWHNPPPKVKAESKRSENAKSKSASEKDTNNAHAEKKKKEVVYYDYRDVIRQQGLWYEAERKHPWHNLRPKIKVTNKKGLYHMNIELTLGTAPDTIYELMIEPKGGPFFDFNKWGDLMKNTSRKVLKENGPRRDIMVEKAVAYNFLSLTTLSIPVHLTMEENRKDLTKGKVMLMKEFHGNYKVEPIYVDQERLCKKRKPKNPEEYKKCSGGQGRMASKLTINHYYEPYPPFNIPPLSWFIRGITIKTSKKLLSALQEMASIARNAKVPPEDVLKGREKDTVQVHNF